MKLTVEIHGEEQDDLVLAIEQVTKSVKEGYLSGFDSNDTGEYYFDIKEEE